MRTYTPNTILIPQEIKEHPTICSYLIGHFHTLKKAPRQQSIMENFGLLGPDTPLDELLTVEEKKDILLSGIYPLFHDIFLREYPGGQQIIAIGVEIQDLTAFIGHPELWHNGKQIAPHKIAKRPVFNDNTTPTSLNLHIINSDPELQFQANDTLELRWTQPSFSFSHTVRLQDYPWLNDTPKLTLNTLQKDNPLEWIRDWILYHHRIHGVERILLYDNGSKGRQELMEFLPQMESESLEICLISWDSTYYPFALSYCQYAQIAHAYHWLWDKTSWDINCDIDEYLINRTGMPLANYLKRYNHPLKPVLILPCIAISSHSKEKKRLRSVTDFTWMTPEIKAKGKNIILGQQEITTIEPHCVRYASTIRSYLLVLLEFIFNQQQAPKKIPSKLGQSRKWLYSLSYIYQDEHNRALFHKGQIFMVYAIAVIISVIDKLPLAAKQFLFPYRKKEWGLYFYHYWGLNQNWKGDRGEQPIPDESCHQDTEILELLKKARVGKYYSQ